MGEKPEEKIARLEEENAAMRKAVALMHRRAQRHEGAAHREQRCRDGYAKDVANQVKWTEFWREKAEGAQQDLAFAIRKIARLELESQKGFFARIFGG